MRIRIIRKASKGSSSLRSTDASNATRTKLFKRNPNLSHIVHALLHLSEFMTVAAIETFHYVHQYINKKIREENPKTPELREEHHVIYVVIPICLIISLFLAIIWIIPKKINSKIELGLGGCFFGAIMMLSNAVLSMRVAQLYINLDKVSDEELLMHPIFIHAFTICILAVFAMTVYLLHFWLFYELWRWNRKLRTLRATSSRTSGIMSQTSSKFIKNSYSSNKKRLDYHNSSSFELSDKNSSTPPRGHVGIKDINDEPVILYCFFIDCWNYLQYYRTKKNNLQNSD